MKKDPLISFILPVYNVAEFLPYCLDSLLNQEYYNYEIILVDDGSSDDCPQICDEYAEKYKNIFVLHKANGGQAAARNDGVQIARGDYICFIDSDDYVSSDYLTYLLGLLKLYDADVALGGLTFVYDNNYKRKGDGQTELLNTEDALKRMCYYKGFGVSPCVKLYPIELVRKYPFPVGNVYEDLATTYRLLSDCKKIAYGSREIYFYRQRVNSTMHEPMSPRHLYGIEAANDLLKFMEKYHPSVVQAAHCRCARKIYEYIPRINGGRNADNLYYYQIFRKELRKHIRYVLKDKETPLILKVRYCAIMLGFSVMKFVWNVTEKIRKIARH